MEIQEQLNEAQARIVTLQQDNARLRETIVLGAARELVREALAGAQVPDVTRARLQEQLSANPPVNGDGALDTPVLATRITEAVTAEQTYLAQASGYGSGRITGMGGSQADPAKQVDVAARMVEAFRGLGLTADEATVAARGRA